MFLGLLPISCGLGRRPLSTSGLVPGPRGSPEWIDVDSWALCADEAQLAHRFLASLDQAYVWRVVHGGGPHIGLGI